MSQQHTDTATAPSMKLPRRLHKPVVPPLRSGHSNSPLMPSLRVGNAKISLPHVSPAGVDVNASGPGGLGETPVSHVHKRIENRPDAPANFIPVVEVYGGDRVPADAGQYFVLLLSHDAQHLPKWFWNGSIGLQDGELGTENLPDARFLGAFTLALELFAA
ncbi:hypothetical protein S40293_11489 [Stachybotrys chartarum IBT 40293]|nr:hypothetical protein S40293_11489 [Stachybotrys chartarum IBT 40293]